MDAANPETVQPCLRQAQRFGRGKTYGNPAQGFAGVYAEPERGPSVYR